MNRKIAIIIFTDFCCWIPFIVTCALHTLSIIDASRWYALFSIVVLPINSVINPMLYDDTMTSNVARSVLSLRNKFSRHSWVVTLTSLIITLRANQGECNQDEDIAHVSVSSLADKQDGRQRFAERGQENPGHIVPIRETAI